jgi:hypothetical protein
MFTDPVELEELRKTTADLIAFNSYQIVLNRGEWERTGGGGQRQINVEPLEPQTLYFGAIMWDPRTFVTPEGERVFVQYVLVGMPGEADIQEKDTFSIGTQEFKVSEVHPDQTYEVRAWVYENA